MTTLFEVLLLRLGGSLSRAAVKRWIGDSDLAGEVASDVTDLLIKAGVDAREAHRARRQLEEVSERVAERLEPYFAIEYRGPGESLTVSEAAAAASAVADTIDSGFTDPRVALDADLDPDRLLELLKAADPDRPARLMLNQAGQRMYEIALSESCSYLVQMVTALPRFQADATRRLLELDRGIIERLEDALERLPAPDTGQQALEFETRYLRAVVHSLDHVQLFGLEDVSAPMRRYMLSVAYISLSATVLTLERRDDDGYSDDSYDDSESDDYDYDDDYDEDDEGFVDQNMQLEEVLSLSRRVLLRGEAGSGKTTLLQWLAVQAALKELPDAIDPGQSAVPFLVRLRRYVDADLPTPAMFINEVASAIAGFMPEQWVENLLESGRAAVLIDGLDELPAARRAHVAGWLDQLVDAFPQARYVVTSRPAAIDSGFSCPPGFSTAQVIPMGPLEISAFVDHWHSAVARSLDDTNQAEVLVLGDTLKGLITQQQSLRRLASNPLMCAVLCALHADRRSSLPSDRVGLYRSALHTLIFRRDPGRGVRFDSGLSEDQMLLVLDDLAWWMVSQGYTDAPKGTAADRMELTLARMPGAPAATDLLSLFLERTGLLSEPVTGRLEFLHKTFLEYLAAEHATRAFEMGFLIASATQDGWSEIIQLAAGIARPRERQELIDGLLQRRASAADRASLHLLAAACADVAPELDTDLRDRVNDALGRLVPPRTVTKGLALARAGDAAVGLLGWRATLTAAEARASIRALAAIATHEAFEQLVPYARDERRPVIGELVRARDSFDPEEFATRVLADSPLDGGALEITETRRLGYLQHLKHLRALTVNARGQTLDLEALASLENLVSLDVQGADEIVRVEQLGRHPKLKNLTLQGLTSLQTLEGLDEMDVASLDLVETPGLEDLRPAAQMPNLRRLRLDDTAAIDLSPFAGNGSLANLLVARQMIEPASALGDIPHLKTLELDRVAGDIDLSWLALSDRLEKLVLRSPEGEVTFATFEHREQPLEYLGIDWSWFDGTVLDGVGGIKQLSVAHSSSPRLLLEGTRAAAVAIDSCAMEILTIPAEAEFLTITNCPALPSLEAVRGHSTLRGICVTDCQGLADVRAVLSCQGLEAVRLENLSAEFDASVLAGLPAARNVK